MDFSRIKLVKTEGYVLFITVDSPTTSVLNGPQSCLETWSHTSLQDPWQVGKVFSLEPITSIYHWSRLSERGRLVYLFPGCSEKHTGGRDHTVNLAREA